MKYGHFLGIFYTLLGSISLSLATVIVKKLSYISPGQLTVVLCTGTWVGCLPIAVYCVREVLGAKKDRLKLVARGLLIGIAFYLNLIAFRYLPLAEASIVLSTMPAVITLMACVYLKEPCGFVQSLALVLTLCGVLLSLRLPELLSKRHDIEFDLNYFTGLASAVGCVLVWSVGYVAVRKMKHVHFSVSLLYIGFIGMLENALINMLASHYEAPQCGWDKILVFLVGILGFLSSCAMTIAVLYEAVGIVSVVKASMDVVFSMIFQVTFLRGKLDVFNFVGASIVIISLCIIGFQRWLTALPEDSRTGKKFKMFLL